VLYNYIDKQPLFDVHEIQKFGQCAYGVTSADFNKDGKIDTATCGATSPWEKETISILYNEGNGEFTQDDVYTIIDPSRPQYIEDLNAADYDNDGDIDLIFTQSEAIWYGGMLVKINGVIKMLKNEGENSFVNCTQIAWHGPGTPYDPENRINPKLTSADFDMDGNIDFLVGDNSGKVEFYINNGTGNFSSAGIIHDWGCNSWGITSCDFDADGDIDFLVAAGLDNELEGYVYLKRNQMIESNFTLCFESGPGETLLHYSGDAACLQSIDFDADGDIDLVIGMSSNIFLCLNNQSLFEIFPLGSLPPDNGYSDVISLGGITAADMNNDGKIDLLTGGVQGIVRLWTNKYDQLPPFTPSIQQPSVFQAHKKIQFNISSVDINHDDISYFVDWGDGTNSGWVGPYPSGQIINLTHTWKRARSYVVSAYAKDKDGESQAKCYILILFPGLPFKTDTFTQRLNQLTPNGLLKPLLIPISTTDSFDINHVIVSNIMKGETS
jgi:hypothetical protein